MEKLDTGTGFGEQIINRYTAGMDTLYKIEKQVQVPGTVFHIFPSNDTGTLYGVSNKNSNGPGTRYNDSLLQVP